MNARTLLQSLAVATLLCTIGAPAGAAVVQSLDLPEGTTIEPEGDHRLMTIGDDGTVYAVVNRINNAQRTLALRWRPSSASERFIPVPDGSDRPEYPELGPRPVLIAATAGMAFVTVERTFDGAYQGRRAEVDRWSDGANTSWPVPACAELRNANPAIAGVTDSRIGLTIDPSAAAVGIDLTDPSSVERNLPRAMLIDDGRCVPLGNAVLTALRGPFAAGYRGYLDGKNAPLSVNLIVQRMVALRWKNDRETTLGAGVAFATTSTGTVAGATALPGHVGNFVTTNFFGAPGTYTFAVPHAVTWSPKGKRSMVIRGDLRSVAWDVNDANVVVGMLIGRDGLHRAFRATEGRVELLDDLPHPEGWRFESAYAVAPDGSIAGIGTYRGVATAFVWR